MGFLSSLANDLQSTGSGLMNSFRQNVEQPTQNFGSGVLSSVRQSAQKAGFNQYLPQSLAETAAAIPNIPYVTHQFYQQHPFIGSAANVGAFTGNLPIQFANSILGQGIIDPTIDTTRNAYRAATNQSLLNYSELRSPQARLGYNLEGINNTPQSIIGNVAGTALPIFNAATLAPAEKALQGATLLDRINEGARVGRNIGAGYSGLQALSDNRDKTLKQQLTQGAVQTALGGITGSVLGGATPIAGEALQIGGNAIFNPTRAKQLIADLPHQLTSSGAAGDTVTSALELPSGKIAGYTPDELMGPVSKNEQRPLFEKVIEQAVNSGDTKTVQDVYSVIPDSNPYKSTTLELMKQRGIAPVATVAEDLANVPGQAADKTTPAQEALIAKGINPQTGKPFVTSPTAPGLEEPLQYGAKEANLAIAKAIKGNPLTGPVGEYKPQRDQFNQSFIDAFDKAGGQKLLTTIGDHQFSLGDIGLAQSERKAGRGQPDRFPISQLPEALNNIVAVFRGNSEPNNTRYLNKAWVSQPPVGDKSIIYTRPNRFGQEEIINWHTLNETKNPNYLSTLESYGTPGGIQTHTMSGLEDQRSIQLNNRGNQTLPQGSLKVNPLTGETTVPPTGESPATASPKSLSVNKSESPKSLRLSESPQSTAPRALGLASNNTAETGQSATPGLAAIDSELKNLADISYRNTVPEPRSPVKPLTIFNEPKAILSPASMSEQSQRAADIVSNAKADIANYADLTSQKARADVAHFEKMTPEQQIASTSQYEKTGTFGNAPSAAYSQFYKESTDKSNAILKEVYGGDRVGYIDNYVKHAFKFGSPADEANGTQILYDNTKSLSASKSSLKTRTINAPLDEALAQMRAQGIKVEPVTTNPELLRQWTVTNARQAATYAKAWEQLKSGGLVKNVTFGDRPPEGMVKLNDRVATIFRPVSATFKEFYDTKVMEGLNSVAEALGITHERALSGKGLGGNRAGASFPGRNLIKTRAGSPESVLAHEIGHQIDEKYGLQKILVNNPETKLELRKLADLRHEGNATAGFKSYVRSGEEKMAVMLEALIHTPDKFRKVAPNTYRIFTGILRQDPQLSPLLKIENSLLLSSSKYTKDLGIAIQGSLYADPNVARVLNNTVSTGLENSPTYNFVRGINNSLNQFELGLSGFHLTGTAINSAISDFTTGVTNLAQGIISLKPEKMGRGLTQMGRAPVPFASFAKDVYKGNSIIEGLKNSSPEAYQFLQEKLNPAGGRLNQDVRYRVGAYDSMVKAFKDPNILNNLGGLFKLPQALIEKTAAPLMEFAIPRAKIGVFSEIAQTALGRLPADATGPMKQRALRMAWDSVDNRFGQLVYDNLFWNKTAKDLAQVSTRSVGWNLGTVREIGGGISDLVTGKGLTERAMYTLALPIYVGVIGAVYQYLHTGKGPQSLMDYFYPQNGLKTASGEPDRTTLPTYMKDIVAYSKAPLQTLEHKTSPLLSLAIELGSNRNYFGDLVRNPNDPVGTQLEQMGSHILQSIQPFSIQQFQKQSQAGASPELKAESFFGFTKAPSSITQSAAQKAVYGAMPPQAPRTPEQVANDTLKSTVRGQVKAGDTSGIQTLIDQGLLTERGAKTFTKNAQLTSEQRAFNSLSKVEQQKILSTLSPADQAYLTGSNTQAGALANQIYNLNATHQAAVTQAKLKLSQGDTSVLNGLTRAQQSSLIRSVRSDQVKQSLTPTQQELFGLSKANMLALVEQNPSLAPDALAVQQAKASLGIGRGKRAKMPSRKMVSLPKASSKGFKTFKAPRVGKTISLKPAKIPAYHPVSLKVAKGVRSGRTISLGRSRARARV